MENQILTAGQFYALLAVTLIVSLVSMWIYVLIKDYNYRRASFLRNLYKGQMVRYKSIEDNKIKHAFVWSVDRKDDTVELSLYKDKIASIGDISIGRLISK